MDPVPVGLKFSAGRPQPISGSQLLSTPGLLPDLMGGISWGESGPRWLFLCRLLSKHLVDSYDMQGCGKERRASPDRRLGRPWECALHSSQALKTPTLLLQGYFESHQALPNMLGDHDLLHYHPGLSRVGGWF